MMRLSENLPLLAVNELAVGIAGPNPIVLVEKLSFCLDVGKIVGIAGQSGSGKTLAVCAVAALLPPPLRVLAGEVFFRGRKLSPADVRHPGFKRGRDLLLLFQSPLSALNPTMAVGLQITKALRASRGYSFKEADQRAREAWGCCGLDMDRFADYPFQLSGGQRQRALLAMAFGLKPGILIADEPTAGQDEENRDLLLGLLSRLCREADMAAVIISHDLRILSQLADELIVLYRGKQVEEGSTSQILGHPRHFHTCELVAAFHYLQRGSWAK